MQYCIFSYIITVRTGNMLKRKIINELLKWKENENKKALVVTGPRQCGKTTAIRYFGAKNYRYVLEINFKETPDMAEMFRGNLNVDTLIMGMQFRFPDIVIDPRQTLIFLDEIQECAEAVTSLKFWTEDHRYNVICSGSLLGIDYNRASSYPVGYVDYIHMHSMDFEEYLWAVSISEEMIRQLQGFFAAKRPVPQQDDRKRSFRRCSCTGSATDCGLFRIFLPLYPDTSGAYCAACIAEQSRKADDYRSFLHTGTELFARILWQK